MCPHVALGFRSLVFMFIAIPPALLSCWIRSSERCVAMTKPGQENQTSCAAPVKPVRKWLRKHKRFCWTMTFQTSKKEISAKKTPPSSDSQKNTVFLPFSYEQWKAEVKTCSKANTSLDVLMFIYYSSERRVKLYHSIVLAVDDVLMCIVLFSVELSGFWCGVDCILVA